MPLDLSPYYVATGEKPASSTKQNNTLQAIQSAINSLPPSQIQGYPANAARYLDGSGNWSVPPSAGGAAWTQMAYTTNNVDVSITATTQAGATVCVTAPAFTSDGGIYWLEYFCGRVYQDANMRELIFCLFLDGAAVQNCGSAGASIGGGVTGAIYTTCHIRLPWTCAVGSRTFSIRAYFTGGSGTCHADGTRFQFIRVTKER
jgi:hypothetical protein